jgi:phosphoglycolate phosphatase-like HAD superfamily hydrolase
MVIVFDMDNTLVDEFGASVRPGIIELLTKLKNQEYTLILWTNSRKERAVGIILDNNLRQFFSKFIFREDYDPEEKGIPKDIRKVNGDILIDDYPEEIKYTKSIGKSGILVKSYRKNSKVEKDEFAELKKIFKVTS